MTRDPVQAFEDAQQAALDASGVVATTVRVPVPSLAGEANVVVTGAGPDVLLVNGIGLPGAFWAPLLAELHGFRLLAVDLPGHGLTTAPPPPPDARTLRSTAVRFLDEVATGLGLDGPLVVVGNSLGSLWSTWLAIDEPRRVRALAHVACPALAPGTSAPLPMRLLGTRGLGRLMLRLRPPSEAQVEQLATMVGEDIRQWPALRDLLLATERLPAQPDVLRKTLRVLVRPRGARPDAAQRVDELRRVTQPVHLVWGDRDPFGSVAAAEALRDALPHASLDVVPGGHAPWLDSADAIARSLRPFLERHTATAGRRAQ